MRCLAGIAICFLSIAGVVYSLFVLADCYRCWRREARTGADAGSGRLVQAAMRATGKDWWCQAISAVVFAVAAAVLLTMVWRQSQATRLTRVRQISGFPETVELHGLPAMTITRITRHRNRPGQPILGVDLANLPVTDSQLRRLVAEEPEIEYLVLTGTRVTDEVMPCLQKLPHLKQLTLQRTPITDSGCRELAKIATLEDLSLSYTAITDQGLAHLGNLPKLAFLYVANTAITDRGLDCLEQPHRLESLDVGRTQVTSRGIRTLEARAPSLQILSD